MYLRDMGVDQESLDIIDRNSDSRRGIEVAPPEWVRMRIVTAPSL
jgi:hypothetical protein